LTIVGGCRMTKTTAWAELTDQTGHRPLALELTFDDFNAQMLAHEITHPFFGPMFQRTADVVIRMALTGLHEKARQRIDGLADLAKAIAATPPGSTLDRLDSPNYIAAAVLLLRSGMGWGETERTAVKVVLERLPEMRQFLELGRESAVLACAAHEEISLAETLLSRAKNDPFTEALVRDRTKARQLWPKWRDGFPDRHAAGKAQWHQMLFAVYILSGGTETPADWLLAQVG
jgi:hypothetical protein